MTGEEWTPFSVVRVIKTDFGIRIYVFLEGALEIALFAQWKDAFPCFVPIFVSGRIHGFLPLTWRKYSLRYKSVLQAE